MNNANISDLPVKISLKLADGDLYTLFHHNEWGEKSFHLVPAHNKQNTAEINIFHSYQPGSKPTLIGNILCKNIPDKPEGRLLSLETSLNSPGLFSAFISHSGSSQPQCMKINLAQYNQPGKKVKSSNCLKTIFVWIAGVIFVFSVFSILFFLITLITRWGSLIAPVHPAA